MGSRISLPSIVSKLPNDVRNFLQRVREALDGTVSLQDLVNGGVVDIDGNGNPIAPEPPPEGDLSTPPAPTGLKTFGAITTIFVEWDDPEYENLAYVEIWRCGEDNLGLAVLIGTTPAHMYADTVEMDSTFYYWVRFVSKTDVVGPYNGVAGTIGQSSIDPGWLLEMLTGEITSSQLHADLGSRIDLIDGEGIGSVNYRMIEEGVARSGEIAAEASARAQALLDEAASRAGGDASLQQQITAISASSSSGLGTLAAVIEDEQIARANGDSAEATSRQTLATQLRGGYTGTDASQLSTGIVYSERMSRITAEGVLASSISALSATVSNNNATVTGLITTEQTARANAVSAEASSRQTLAAKITGFNDPTGQFLDNLTSGLIYEEKTTRVSADGALSTRATALEASVNNPTTGLAAKASVLYVDTAKASAIATAASATALVSARLDTGDFAAVKTESSASASSVTGLKAQYTVKIDAGGKVCGFGLASATNTTTSSIFEVRADRVAFLPPYGSGASSVAPFIVDTTTNRVAMDGAYMKAATITSAAIASAAITNAHIQTVSASKLTAGTITSQDITLNGSGVVLSTSGTVRTTGKTSAGTSASPNTSAGVFMGYDSGYYKIAACNSGFSAGFLFDGISLVTKGIFLAGTGGSSNGYAFEVNGNYTWVGTLFGNDIAITNYGTAAADQIAHAGAVSGQSYGHRSGIAGNVASTNSSAYAHGARGINYYARTHSSLTSSGIVGCANGYDFYADGTTSNYGPFTGSHEVLIDVLDEIIQVGDILVDVECISRRNLSNTIFSVTRSSCTCQNAIGVLSARSRNLNEFIPAAFIMPDLDENEQQVPSEEYEIYRDDFVVGQVNSLGEGSMLVCGEGGNLSNGDLIVTSSIPGKGMRQADDIIRSYTVAKAREPVTFTDTTTVKQVACIYLCG